MQPDLEMLTVSLRLHYRLQKFPTVVFSCVYIPLDANNRRAAELLAGEASTMAPVFIMGHYNSCSLDTALPSFQQYVDIPTTRQKYIGFLLWKHH